MREGLKLMYGLKVNPNFDNLIHLNAGRKAVEQLIKKLFNILPGTTQQKLDIIIPFFYSTVKGSWRLGSKENPIFDVKGKLIRAQNKKLSDEQGIRNFLYNLKGNFALAVKNALDFKEVDSNPTGKFIFIDKNGKKYTVNVTGKFSKPTSEGYKKGAFKDLTQLRYLDVSNNSLNQTAINDIISDLYDNYNASPRSRMNVDIRGTNNASPSGAALEDIEV